LLVAQGLTNARIAEELFVSPDTVNRHLNSIYHKQGVSFRAAGPASPRNTTSLEDTPAARETTAA
jgi:hypothetical protein